MSYYLIKPYFILLLSRTLYFFAMSTLSPLSPTSLSSTNNSISPSIHSSSSLVTSLGLKFIFEMPSDMQHEIVSFLDVAFTCVCSAFHTLGILPFQVRINSLEQLKEFGNALQRKSEKKRKLTSQLLCSTFEEFYEKEKINEILKSLEVVVALLPRLEMLMVPLLFGPGQYYSCEGDFSRINVISHVSIIADWVYERTGIHASVPFRLVYEASKDGFRGVDFHRLCDGIKRLLVIIRSVSGFLFGGFSSIPFKSSRSVLSDNQAFVFTLLNPHDIPPTMFPSKTSGGLWDMDEQSYGPCYSKPGPQSGDLWLRDECNINGGGSYLGFGYEDTIGMRGAVFTLGLDFRRFFEFELIDEVLAFSL